MIFIASLFVVSEGLDAGGVTTWAGQQLISLAGASRRRLLVLMMVLVAGLTALIRINAAVAALLPIRRNLHPTGAEDSPIASRGHPPPARRG